MYCTPLEIHDQADTLTNAKASESKGNLTVDGGTITLENSYLVENAFPSDQFSSQNDDQDIRLFVDNSLVDPSEYEVNLRDGIIEETGTAISNGTSVTKVRYKHSDVPNEVVKTAIEAVTDHIDDLTNTTFGGTNTRTDEIYDGEGGMDSIYQFDGQPVDQVTSVEVNTASIGNPDNWKTLTEGRAEDYVEYQGVGIMFMDSENAPDDEPRNLRVTYDYGFPNVPKPINLLCRRIVIKGLANDQTFSAVIDGVDDFNPETTTNFNKGIQEVVDEWKVRTDLRLTNLSEKGQES